MTTMLAEGRTAQTAPVTGHQPKMDTAVTAGGLEYVIEVPGVKAAELELQVVGGTIVVRGRQDLDQTNRTYRAVERAHGPFLRTLSVPEGARLQDIEAALDRGLLTVFIPNPPILAGRTIAVNSTVQRLLAGDDRYELKLDLPGVDASDITLVVRDGRLTIGRREATLMAETADQPGDQASGPAEAPSVSRIIQSMELPAGVDANLIGAVLAKGVLTVTLPIVAGYRRRIIPVEAEG
jgi:HSP20 family protein